MTTFTIAPGPLGAAFEDACARLDRLTFADALWNRRPDVFTKDPAVQRLVANRLGWVRVLDVAAAHVERVRAFAGSVQTAGFTDVLLLGMGGSSLAPEVISRVVGVAPGFPRFRMLDSVDPDAVRAAMGDTRGVLFVMASKSGSTIEPTVLAAEARRRSREAEAARWGPNVIAITDPGTVLEAQARRESFREVFINPPDIGGRYSALSLFGLVPAALMGVNLDTLLGDARAMVDACRQPRAAANPGLALGALMAAGAQKGRDKLTLLVPPQLASLGLWVEQLVAESTGKQGAGVDPDRGRGCRRAVRVGPRLRGDHARRGRARPGRGRARPGVGRAVRRVADAVSTRARRRVLPLGGGDRGRGRAARDQPVRRAERLAGEGRHAGLARHLPQPAAPARAGGPRRRGRRAVHPQPHRPGVGRQRSAVRRLQRRAAARLRGRARLSAARRSSPSTPPSATCAPRSRPGPGAPACTGTGRATSTPPASSTRAGPTPVVFLVVTAEPQGDLPVPEEPFSFGVLEMAQALGDFQSLDRTGRRAVHVHLPRRDPQLLKRVADRLLG